MPAKIPDPWRERVHEIIFEADTPLGKLFDIGLMIAIILSVTTVALESVGAINDQYAAWLWSIEWFFTFLFTVEYVLRLLCVKKPLRYAISFLGIIDLLSILPTYLRFFVPSTSSLAVLRTVRLLRIFRILKLARLLRDADLLYHAVWAARGKIVVFLTTVLIVVTISGTIMYVVENPGEDAESSSGFTSIPQSMYWAVVTMTTVGYGDVVPLTTAGKITSTLLILLGYSLIIVPTGFVSAELVESSVGKTLSTQACPHCMAEGHDVDARHCKLCGGRL